MAGSSRDGERLKLVARVGINVFACGGQGWCQCLGSARSARMRTGRGISRRLSRERRMAARDLGLGVHTGRYTGPVKCLRELGPALVLSGVATGPLDACLLAMPRKCREK